MTVCWLGLRVRACGRPSWRGPLPEVGLTPPEEAAVQPPGWQSGSPHRPGQPVGSWWSQEALLPPGGGGPPPVTQHTGTQEWGALVAAFPV